MTPTAVPLSEPNNLSLLLTPEPTWYPAPAKNTTTRKRRPSRTTAGGPLRRRHVEHHEPRLLHSARAQPVLVPERVHEVLGQLAAAAHRVVLAQVEENPEDVLAPGRGAAADQVGRVFRLCQGP